MDKKLVAKELLKIAKSLLANGSSFTKFVGLYNEYQKADSETLKKIQKEIDELRSVFINDYIEYIVKYLKESKPSDPTMVFLGSLDYNIEEEITKKYFGKDYPGIVSRFNDISSKKLSMKPIFKKAFDKAFGAGIFEKALENNKKK